MDRRRRWAAVKAAAALLLLSTASHGAARTEPSVKNNEQQFAFNYTLAKTIVEYASAVYMTDLTALYTWTCSRCNDLTRGFEVRCIIVDVQNCLQAIVGVDHNLNAIIVAIRGTQENSIQNWIKDLVWKQVDLNYPNLPNAKVHTGFYSSYNNTLLRPAITNAVRKARKLYGDINIIITGHSMGGAIASFCALDLAIAKSGVDEAPQLLQALGEATTSRLRRPALLCLPAAARARPALLCLPAAMAIPAPSISNPLKVKRGNDNMAGSVSGVAVADSLARCTARQRGCGCEGGEATESRCSGAEPHWRW